MHNVLKYMIIFIGLFLITIPSTLYGSEKDYSEALRNVKLLVPDKPEDRAYLGLKETRSQIPLTYIKAEILIIEIFSMYCPHCQKHAPVANKLYQAIDSKEEFRDKIKIVGIGVGNSPYEIAIFQNKYSLAFPLFDDRNSAIVNAFAGILTPHYFGLRIKKDQSFEVFYSKAGGFTDADEFLEMIIKSSGISLGGDQ